MKNLFHWYDNKIQMIISALFVLIIGIFKPVVGFIAAIGFAYIIYLNYTSAQESNKKIDRYVEDLSETFESATKHAIFNMPFPLVMIDEIGNIIWYNTPFIDMIIEDDDILNEKITDFVSNFNLKQIIDGEENEPVAINYDDRDYSIQVLTVL